MCLYPKLIRNKKYTANKKNGGIIPAVNDLRTTYVPIKCNKCMECMKQKKNEWKNRLKEDIKEYKNGKFITLTFNNEEYKKLYEIADKQGYNKDNQIAKIAVRRFLERWRKTYGKSLRHWLITELGHNGTENIHLHGIIWTDEDTKTVRNHWKYGYIFPHENWKNNFVSEKTINYITKYVTKTDIKHKYYTPKILCSQGIGKYFAERTATEIKCIDRTIKKIDGEWYLVWYVKNKRKVYYKTQNHTTNKYTPNNTRETYTDKKGYKGALPIYWRNKIYTEEEREKLWIEKLEKGIRFVNGIEINIKTGMEEYREAIKYARIKNKQLGYGSDEINWNEKDYEEKLRELKQLERIKNNNNNKKPETNEERVKREYDEIITKNNIDLSGKWKPADVEW